MQLPIEWIKEYVTLPDSPRLAEDLEHRIAMTGLEVEGTKDSDIGLVIDLKVTPNRGDCLSVLGLARELSASYGVPLGSVKRNESAEVEVPPETGVKINAPDLCPRYTTRLIRNVKIVPSPPWMQSRLIAAGMRPVNGIVDVTNYVMLEVGQPLHAFDFDTLAGGRIVVRRANAGETLRTLDGEERALTPEMLVIADAEKPIALAGIMGGAETEISDRTQTLLLESAHFHPRSVRRTARQLGMRTEASYRFERTVDPALAVLASDRACTLIEELGMGDAASGVVDVYPVPPLPRAIALRPERVQALLGFPVSEETLIASLTRLGFGVVRKLTANAEGEPNAEQVRARPGGPTSSFAHAVGTGSDLAFTVPSWRPDVVREIDLVEEVGRVVGYEQIPERLPTGITLQGGDSAWGQFAERVRDLLSGAGLQEIVSHTLLSVSPYEDARTADERIAIRSALSEELSGLRRSVLPGLIEAMERNARRGQTPLAFYEVGHVFRKTVDGYSETTAIGGALAGCLLPSSWLSDARAVPADYYTLQGLMERLLAGLGVVGAVYSSREDDPRLHPGRAATLHLAGQEIGFLGELHPHLTADLTVKERVLVFELSFEAVQAAAQRGARFAPLSAYPAVTRDLAPRLANDLPYAQVTAAIMAEQIAILERFALTDVYTGANLPEGMKSLTLSFTLRALDHTLTEAEVNACMERLRGVLEKACGATFPH